MNHYQRRFSLQVRQSLKFQEYSLRQAAKRAGISPSSLSRILSGEHNLPSDKKILKIAKALKIDPPEELLLEIGRVPLNQPRLRDLLYVASRLTRPELDDIIEEVEQTIHSRRLRESFDKGSAENENIQKGAKSKKGPK